MSELERPARNHSFGYARVSTDDQDLSLQIDALVRYGINARDIFTDKISGAKEDWPGLTKCLATLRPGDTLVVWRLDRLATTKERQRTSTKDARMARVSLAERP